MKRRNRNRILYNNQGSAMVAVLMLITVLLVLGMGLLTLTTANAQLAGVDNVYERDYYTADSGAKQGVEALKNFTLEQYRLIAADVKTQGTANTTLNSALSFFNALDAFTYSAPQPDSSAGGPKTLSVLISYTTVNTYTQTFTVKSTASDGKTARAVSSSFNINFVPVTMTVDFAPLGDQTIITGGTLVQNSGYSSFTNNTDPTHPMRFGSLPNMSSYALNGTYKADLSPYVDPNTATALSWNMDYPGFTSSAKPSSAQLSLPAFTSATSITNSSFGGTAPSPVYLDLEGSSGTYTIQSFDQVGGTIYCTTSLTDKSPHITGTSSNYVKIYCKGNLLLDGVIASYVKIYCDGNVTINGGSSYRNIIIYCNGTLNDSCTDRYDVRYYCKDYKMSGGNFHNDNIVYAENTLHLESTVTGLFYSNGTIDIGGGTGLTGGQIAAKGNITLNGSFDFKYDPTMLQRLNTDWFPTSTGQGTATVVQPVTSLVYNNSQTYQEQ